MRKIIPVLLMATTVAATSAAEQAKLKGKPLPAPSLTMTADDVATDALCEGLVRTPIKLEFKNSDTSAQDVQLGELAFKLGLRGSGIIVEANGKGQQLKSKGNTLPPTMLPLPNKQKFALAFPIYDRGRTTTAIYMRGALSQAGKIGKDTMLFYDSNQDTELTSEDGYCSAKTPMLFAPIKSQIVGAKGVYTFDGFSSDEKNRYADYSPYEGETVDFPVKTAGGKAQILAVFTKTDDSLAFVVDGKTKKIPVTPGDYELSYGMALGKNGNAQQVVARIETGEFKTVTAGEKVAIGGPYTMRFEVRKTTVRGKPVLMISPNSLKVFGKNGEEYKEYRYKTLPSVTLEGKKPANLGSFEYG